MHLPEILIHLFDNILVNFWNCPKSEFEKHFDQAKYQILVQVQTCIKLPWEIVHFLLHYAEYTGNCSFSFLILFMVNKAHITS